MGSLGLTWSRAGEAMADASRGDCEGVVGRMAGAGGCAKGGDFKPDGKNGERWGGAEGEATGLGSWEVVTWTFSG